MNKKIVHDALILFAFTIVLGLLLGVVYGVTKPSIDKVNEEKTQNAYKQVFTDADHFTDYADFDADAAQALLDENGYSDEIETVVAATGCIRKYTWLCIYGNRKGRKPGIYHILRRYPE